MKTKVIKRRGKYAVRIIQGNQSFDMTTPETREEAKWLANMFDIAISNFIADLKTEKTVILTRKEFKRLLSSERIRIELALQINKGSRKKTARMLGISERTLYRKVLEYQFPYKTNFV